MRGNSAGSVAIEEFDRQRRVVDQMVTIQSRARDIYQRRAMVLKSLILALAVAVGAFAFAGNIESEVLILGIELSGSQWIGVGSSLVFFLSLVELLVSWESRSIIHRFSAARLAELKAEYRSAERSAPNFAEHCKDLSRRYASTMSMVAHPPDRWMLRLKAYHVRKVKVSKMISAHPGTPLTLLRIRAYWAKEEADE